MPDGTILKKLDITKIQNMGWNQNRYTKWFKETIKYYQKLK